MTLARTSCFALVAAVALGACDAIVGAGDRKLDTTIVCTDDGCDCAFGYDDCDGDADNGCETYLEDPDHCGECFNVCDNGLCEDFACACEGTFTECDGDPITVCETDLVTSGDHCGLCGRSCAGQPCDDGQCAVQQLGNVSPVFTFILVGPTIYLAPYNAPGIHRMSTDGSGFEKVGSDQVYAYAMAAKGTSIYWTAPNDVRATSTLTGTTTVVATPTKTYQGIAVGGGKVYWGQIEGTPQPENAGPMRLMRTTLTPGGTVEEIALLGDGMFQRDFVATDEHVYWTQDPVIRRATHTGTSGTTFLEPPSLPTYLTLAGDVLLFAGLMSSTYLAPLDGGQTQQLAKFAGYGPLTADEAHVYFVTYVTGDQTGFLARAQVRGEPLMLTEDTGLKLAKNIVVDDQWVYWVGGAEGHILRIAK